MEKRRGHVVVFSTLEQGHLIPCFQFCLNLAHRGLAITFVTTPLNASKLNPRLQQASSNGLPIRIEQLSLPPVQGLPPGHESCDTLPSSQMGNLYLATEQLQAPLEGLLQRLSQEDQPPTCVVGDMFTGWVTQTAVKLGFPAFTFLTSPAYGTLVYNSLWSHLPHLSTQSADIRVPDVPFVSVDRSELSPALQMADRSSPWHLFVSRQVKKNRLNHGHIVNTFHDLEPQMIEFMEKSTGKPVWSVGPVLPSDFINGIGISSSALSASERGKEATIEEKVCLEWLDEREAASVIYISFGSRNLVSPAQIEQLALGLEASGKPFIWAMRTCPQGEGEGEGEGAWESFLPPGFQKRTKGRGLGCLYQPLRLEFHAGEPEPRNSHYLLAISRGAVPQYQVVRPSPGRCAAGPPGRGRHCPSARGGEGRKTHYERRRGRCPSQRPYAAPRANGTNSRIRWRYFH
uniref:UDP-glycosyltransferase n=1 Tax=Ginkgo biloba TaxID=3311 RepID=A0A2Z2PHZ8_GINBI|nr:UDP-glycosyltransferase [Ginkgo biloba]